MQLHRRGAQRGSAIPAGPDLRPLTPRREVVYSERSRSPDSCRRHGGPAACRSHRARRLRRRPFASPPWRGPVVQLKQAVGIEAIHHREGDLLTGAFDRGAPTPRSRSSATPTPNASRSSRSSSARPEALPCTTPTWWPCSTTCSDSGPRRVLMRRPLRPSPWRRSLRRRRPDDLPPNRQHVTAHRVAHCPGRRQPGRPDPERPGRTDPARRSARVRHDRHHRPPRPRSDPRHVAAARDCSRRCSPGHCRQRQRTPSTPNSAHVSLGAPTPRSTLSSRSTAPCQRQAVLAHPSQAVPSSALWRRLELLGDTEHLRHLTAGTPE